MLCFGQILLYNLEYHDLQLFSLKDDLEEKEEKLSRMIEKMSKPRIIISILLFSPILVIPNLISGGLGKPKKSMLDRVNRGRMKTKRKLARAKRKRDVKRNIL